MGMHDGHRERMKQRFLEYGLDSFADHNVLELLLFFAVPRRDTNPLAHALLNRFGSLEAVLEADVAELKKVPGIGDSAAALIHLVPQISKRYFVNKGQHDQILNSTAAAGRYLVPRFFYERSEVVYVLCLDAKRKVLCCKEISRGEVNTAEVSIRKIVEVALSHNATSVILAHNHTSGVAIPSVEDEAVTKQIRTALNCVGIALTDHIVVGGEDFVSMAESGLL